MIDNPSERRQVLDNSLLENENAQLATQLGECEKFFQQYKKAVGEYEDWVDDLEQLLTEGMELMIAVKNGRIKATEISLWIAKVKKDIE